MEQEIEKPKKVSAYVVYTYLFTQGRAAICSQHVQLCALVYLHIYISYYYY